MKCVITGSRGYLGSQITKLFKSKGVEVIEWVRKPARGAIRFVLGEPIDQELLRGVDCVVHSAWDMQPTSIEKAMSVNVEGSKNLFNAAQKAGVRRTLFISSMAAFPEARSIYGKTKLIVEEHGKSRGVMSVRPGLIYGENPGGMLGSLMNIARKLPILPYPATKNPFYLCEDKFISQALWEFSNLVDGEFTNLTKDPLTIANDRPWLLDEILRTFLQSIKKNERLVPIPPVLILTALDLMEKIGIRGKFRKDSLVSLIYQNACPDFGPAHKINLYPPVWTLEMNNGKS